MTKEDILQYLDSLHRPEASDPLHKWIGSYNLKRSIIVKFFKWLYYPDIESTQRPNPWVVENIARLKRREQSIYKPTDLWSQEDDLLFLKYCPSKRDRCYHTISRDRADGCGCDYMADLIDSSSPAENKNSHEWAQSPIEAQQIISKLTLENQIVMDPMMGSGTTGNAALKLKRRFIGVERDPKRFAIAKSSILSSSID